MATKFLVGLPYEVHANGDIEKRRGIGFLKAFPDKDGYLKVVICKFKRSHNFFVHRIVYEAFHGPIPDGVTVDHIDGNKLNNHIDNLQLLSVRDNVIKGNAKLYQFISPEGVVFVIYNLREFCRERGLHHAHMYAVHNEHKSYYQHKGWRKYHE